MDWRVADIEVQELRLFILCAEQQIFVCRLGTVRDGLRPWRLPFEFALNIHGDVM
jgi:hypothetical protein